MDMMDFPFATRDIASFEGVEKVDMVVTLHACDLATDYALEKAVNWGARVILSVPCCQHELNGQMENSLLRPSTAIRPDQKEHMAALYTDTIRAQVLEYRGYRTQILEGLNMGIRQKNILIRAVRQGKKQDNGLRIRELAEFTAWEAHCGRAPGSGALGAHERQLIYENKMTGPHPGIASGGLSFYYSKIQMGWLYSFQQLLQFFEAGSDGYGRRRCPERNISRAVP